MEKNDIKPSDIVAAAIAVAESAERIVEAAWGQFREELGALYTFAHALEIGVKKEDLI